MATITKKFTVCDTCGREGDTTPFRVGAITGSTRQVDLCDDDKGPLVALLAKTGGVRRRPGRPASHTVEEIDKMAEEHKAAAKPAPRKRAARKVAQVKA